MHVSMKVSLTRIHR